jgi:hypothetical protein
MIMNFADGRLAHLFVDFSRHRAPMQVALLIVLVVFVIDVCVPAAVVIGVLHLLGVIVTLTCRRRQETLVVAGVATTFVLAADVVAEVFFQRGDGETEIWKILFNQAITITAIWGTAFVIYLRGKALDELAVVSRQLQKELDYASRLQHNLYPKRSPQIAGVDVSGTVLPADKLCGDYYDYLEMPARTHGFVIGDVSGHGVGQSLIMSEVRSTLRSLVKSTSDLGEILEGVNRRLMDDSPEDIFVTLMIVRLDPQTMTFTYAAAGHSGLLFRASGECEELRSDSLALGLSRDARYVTQDARKFHVGDTLLLATDGLEERHSPNDELFGRARLIDEVNKSRDCSSQQVIERLVSAASKFARGVEPHDDVTLIVVKRLAQTEADQPRRRQTVKESQMIEAR